MSNVGKMSIEPPLEQQTISAKFSRRADSFVEFEREEIEQSIPSRFEKTAAKYPDRLAVKTNNEARTYRELNEMANRIARAILTRRAKGAEPIALLLEHGARVIAAIFGVLKAGKFYVPLDPNDPPARIASMLEDSQAALVVMSNKFLALLNEVPSLPCPTLNIDELDVDLSEDDLGLPLAPTGIAYVGYTSGSEGKPKGVIQTHRNVLHSTMVYTNRLKISADDRLSLLNLCSDGASNKNLFGALLNGGLLLPFDVKSDGVTQLPRFIAEQSITIIQVMPPLFRNLTDCITGAEDFSKLRIIHLGGEAATKKDIAICTKHFSSNCIVATSLASRESMHVCFNLIDKSTEISGDLVPVGPPVEDVEVFLADENDKQVRENQVGEIVIKSRYLSPGYWRAPDLTEAKFHTASENSDERLFKTGDLARMRRDGSIEYLGRKDARLKIRGYSVEIVEVETALLSLDTVKEAVVVGQHDRDGNELLVAYIVPPVTPAPTGPLLRSAMAERLPSYMIPSSFVMLDALPRFGNGKVDRSALRAPVWDRSQADSLFVAPRSPVEKILADIWAEALGVKQIGVKDNFFDLGGHSLSATRITLSVHAAFQVELTWRVLFDNPTIEKLALTITEELMNLERQEKGRTSSRSPDPA